MNILIVDDDAITCDTLEGYIKSYFLTKNPGFSVNVEKFTNLQWMFTYFENGNTADAVFMDILLKDSNGIHEAIKLQQVNSSMALVFITGYIEYAKNIFDAKPVYFLVKPIEQKDMYKALDKVMEYRDRNINDTLTFKDDGIVYKINKRDIIYIEASGKNVRIFVENKVYKANDSLKNIMEKTKDRLVQCHRCYLINTEKIRKLDKFQIEMMSGHIIPVSRGKRKEIYDILCMENE